MKMDSLNIEELSCPVCHAIFKAPVLLSCSHNVCKECLHQLWRTKETRECPVCGRTSSKNPSCNLVLKNLCKSFLKERNERRSADSEEICSLHGEKLKFLSKKDKKPACSVCRDRKKYANKTFKPIKEDVPAYKVRQVYICNPGTQTSLKSHRYICSNSQKYTVSKLLLFFYDKNHCTMKILCQFPATNI